MSARRYAHRVCEPRCTSLNSTRFTSLADALHLRSSLQRAGIFIIWYSKSAGPKWDAQNHPYGAPRVSHVGSMTLLDHHDRCRCRWWGVEHASFFKTKNWWRYLEKYLKASWVLHFDLIQLEFIELLEYYPTIASILCYWCWGYIDGAALFILIRFEAGYVGNRWWIRGQGLGGRIPGQESTEAVGKHGNGQPGAGGPSRSSQLRRSGACQAV